MTTDDLLTDDDSQDVHNELVSYIPYCNSSSALYILPWVSGSLSFGTLTDAQVTGAFRLLFLLVLPWLL